jgi:hypothetical protein
MIRTKWMRLIVRDPADVLRWANEESVRQLDAFRYRVIGGREYISFRMVPRYAIEIGTREIIVVACARGRASRRLALAMRSVCHRFTGNIASAFSWLVAPRPLPSPAVARTATLYQLPPQRLEAPSRL